MTSELDLRPGGIKKSQTGRKYVIGDDNNVHGRAMDLGLCLVVEIGRNF